MRLFHVVIHLPVCIRFLNVFLFPPYLLPFFLHFFFFQIFGSLSRISVLPCLPYTVSSLLWGEKTKDVFHLRAPQTFFFFSSLLFWFHCCSPPGNYDTFPPDLNACRGLSGYKCPGRHRQYQPFSFLFPCTGYSRSSAISTVIMLFTPLSVLMEEGCVPLLVWSLLLTYLTSRRTRPPLFSGVTAIEVYKYHQIVNGWHFICLDEGYFCVLGIYIPQ